MNKTIKISSTNKMYQKAYYMQKIKRIWFNPRVRVWVTNGNIE